MKILTLILSILLITSLSLNPKRGMVNNIEFRDIKDDTLANQYNVYKQVADSILCGKNTKLSGQILADAWLLTKEKYGIDIPVTLALAQVKLESSYATSLLSVKKNNPYSLRNKSGYKIYKNLSDGVNDYYKLMATRYLNCKKMNELLKNFVSCQGYRFAGSKDYESSLKREISIINKKIR